MLILVLGLSLATVYGASTPTITSVTSVTKCVFHGTEKPINKPILSSSTEKLYPLNGQGGDIYISSGSVVTASCAPSSNLLANFNVNQVEVGCAPDGNLTVNGGATTYLQLGCINPLKEEIIRTNGTLCYKSNFSNISIEFDNTLRKFQLISLCHDEINYNTIMSKHKIYGKSLTSAEVSNIRPSFKKAQFYSQISPQTAYTQTSQKDMVQSLVNSSQLADKYINLTASYFFARGHLAPDGDFIDVVEQNATYYFVNVVPQWQSINNGNWKAMELAVKNLSTHLNSTLTIYTGGFGILKLNDVNNNPVDIYLARDPSTGQLVLPVPRLIWKIVHDPILKAAIVIVMVNNPHDDQIKPEDVLCTNVCDQITWVYWNTTNIQKGFTYCCSLSTFKSKVDYAPKLGTVKLLV